MIEIFPFQLLQKEERLLGCGVLDNKRPVVYGARDNLTLKTPISGDLITVIQMNRRRAFVTDDLTAVLKTGESLSVKRKRDSSNASELGEMPLVY